MPEQNYREYNPDNPNAVEPTAVNAANAYPTDARSMEAVKSTLSYLDRSSVGRADITVANVFDGANAFNLSCAAGNEKLEKTHASKDNATTPTERERAMNSVLSKVLSPNLETDKDGRVSLQVKANDGSSTTYRFNNMDDALAGKHQSIVHKDEDGRITKEEQNDGRNTTFTYDKDNSVKHSVTADKDGRTLEETIKNKDAGRWNRFTGEKPASDKWTTLKYDAEGKLTLQKVRDKDGNFPKDVDVKKVQENIEKLADEIAKNIPNNANPRELHDGLSGNYIKLQRIWHGASQLDGKPAEAVQAALNEALKDKGVSVSVIDSKSKVAERIRFMAPVEAVMVAIPGKNGKPPVNGIGLGKGAYNSFADTR